MRLSKELSGSFVLPFFRILSDLGRIYWFGNRTCCLSTGKRRAMFVGNRCAFKGHPRICSCLYSRLPYFEPCNCMTHHMIYAVAQTIALSPCRSNFSSDLPNTAEVRKPCQAPVLYALLLVLFFGLSDVGNSRLRHNTHEQMILCGIMKPENDGVCFRFPQ